MLKNRRFHNLWDAISSRNIQDSFELSVDNLVSISQGQKHIHAYKYILPMFQYVRKYELYLDTAME